MTKQKQDSNKDDDRKNIAVREMMQDETIIRQLRQNNGL